MCVRACVCVCCVSARDNTLLYYLSVGGCAGVSCVVGVWVAGVSFHTPICMCVRACVLFYDCVRRAEEVVFL